MTAVQIRPATGRTCRRCASTLCLTAQVDNGGPGRTVPLCPGCDRGNPDARDLIDYLAEHEAVRPQDRGRVTEMVHRWLGSLEAPDAQARGLAEAAEAWWAARRR